MKKIICLIIMLVLLVSLFGISYGDTEQETKVTLKKIECTKNAGFQKFVLKINNNEFSKTIDNDFESVWFEGEQPLTVNSKSEVKISLKRLLNTWKTEFKIVKLEEGDNTINFKYGECFNLNIIINLEIPETPTPSTSTSTSSDVTPSTSQDVTPSSSIEPTPSTTETTTIITEIPATTSTPLTTNNVDELPKTGENNPVAYMLIGFCLLCSGLYLVIRWRLNKSH